MNKKLLILFLIITNFALNKIYAENTRVFWASKLISSSDEDLTKNNAPFKILGKYNVMPFFGKSTASWNIPFGVKRNQFVEVGFDTAILVKQIVVCENYNPGSIAKITLFTKNGKKKEVYENNNPLPFVGGQGRFFNVILPNSDIISNHLLLELNTASFYDDTQIDAIGISSDTIEIKPAINLIQEAVFTTEPEALKNINSPYSELAPIITSDGKTLYFTREGHPDNYGFEKQQDVWYSNYDEFTGEFKEPINIGPPINNAYNNFAISVTPDNNSLLLGNVYRKDTYPLSGISISHRYGNSWTFPEKVEIQDLVTKSRQNSYNLANDGKTLLLSIISDTTYGEHDLYVSFLNSDGTWSKPMNLGPEINTPANEESPFLASDGKTLYFSGNGYPGFGSNDIFFTRRLDESWKKWSEPINLGSKINSIYWDAYFSVTASGDYAYFVSSTDKPYSEDIYRIKLPQAVKPTYVVLLSGRVLNGKTMQPLAAKIVYEELPSGKEIGIARSNDSTGEYKITLPAGKRYGFLASSPGYIAINQNIDLTNLSQYQEISKDLILIPIEVGETIQINNIFFETGKFELLEDSKPELNRIVKLFQDKQIKKIRIAGHTDDVGSIQDNQILSENRAKSVANYLISKGVLPEQIITIGYGELKPIASNATEEGRQKNRRVEFEILEK
ncbi:MAG: OmpA family protein [Candidatus Kapaibacteriota bacterium]